jgi:hypothetical protein
MSSWHNDVNVICVIEKFSDGRLAVYYVDCGVALTSTQKRYVKVLKSAVAKLSTNLLPAYAEVDENNSITHEESGELDMLVVSLPCTVDTTVIVNVKEIKHEENDGQVPSL